MDSFSSWALTSANRRLSILKYWLLGNKNEISFKALSEVVFGKSCVERAKQMIVKLEETSDHTIVYIKDIDSPLFYPKEVDIHYLYAVIAELCDCEHWHYYEIAETKVEKNDIVLDCGAAEGLFGLQVSSRCKEVFCIEPLPVFVKSLNRTFESINNAKIVPIALSNKKQQSYISLTGTSSIVNDNKGYPIEVDTIDSYFKNIPINYIKADLEGFEVNMLQGAKDTIKKYNPKIAITTYHVKEHSELITSYLKSINNNYKIKYKGLEPMGTPTMLHAWVEN